MDEPLTADFYQAVSLGCISGFETTPAYAPSARLETKPASPDAGSHAVPFDGSNLASGIYFARLTADGFTAAQKLVLLK